ncbi:GNAT family N-acetyltransferase [Paenibacillus tyrfis]|uniref:GNAT family N-acetyltransferase n=1 Tax=Paenibacillus tyrfis TaxID=1501230 RepID=UPI000B596E73|nr:GNAT family N-acetyltransferase [Paenibacillus tyrfis]MCP1311914.1 GNAT family N-acetyltransferase [Paenibacillus tyrfis]
MDIIKKILIRDAMESEQNVIRAIVEEAYVEYVKRMEESMREEYYRRLLTTLETKGFVERIVAEFDGNIVGSVLLYPSTSSANERVVRNPGWAELRLLAVLPSARGQGVGASLIQECIRRARINGEKTIGLHTKDEMRSAVHLYERLGFTRFQELDFSPATGILIKGYCYNFDE